MLFDGKQDKPITGIKTPTPPPPPPLLPPPPPQKRSENGRHIKKENEPAALLRCQVIAKTVE